MSVPHVPRVVAPVWNDVADANAGRGHGGPYPTSLAFFWVVSYRCRKGVGDVESGRKSLFMCCAFSFRDSIVDLVCIIIIFRAKALPSCYHSTCS